MDSDTVQLTLATAITSNNVTLTYAKDNTAENKAVLTDSTTGNTAAGVSKLPADVFSDFSITIIDPRVAVIEDILGNADGIPATATEINAIDSVSGAVEGRDYSLAFANGTYDNNSSPTAVEIQAVITAVNASETAIATSNTALTAIGAEDDAKSSDVSIAELNSILPALTDVVEANEAAYQAYIADEANTFDAPATVAQIQAMITAVNASETAIAAVLTDGTNQEELTTAGVTDENLTAVELEAITAALLGTTPTTTAELQAIVDAAIITVGTSSNNVLIVVDIIGTNTNGTTITSDELNDITGVEDARDDVDYTAALQTGIFNDPANPTAAEIQAVIDAVNASNDALDEVVEDIAGNDNDREVTADELNAIKGISSAISATSYTQALQTANYVDSTNPTVAEIRSVIVSVNAQNELVEDITGNANGVNVTPAALNDIRGIAGARDGVDYSSALEAGTYADEKNPTAEEIQAIIDSENSRLPKDDISKDNELSSTVSVNVLDNDPVGLLNVATIQITGTQNPGDELVVEGEGTWTIGVDGEIIFRPETGFEFDPTDINYTVENTEGQRVVQVVVNVNYTSRIRSDSKVVSFTDSVKVDVLANDNGDLNTSSVEIVITAEYRTLHPEAVLSNTVTAEGFFKVGDESGQQLVVPGEGTWWVNSDGTIGYKAQEGIEVVNPTPISYKVYDNSGNELNADNISITLKSTAVGGVNVNVEDCQTSDSVSSFNSYGLGLMIFIGTLFGAFLFRKEKN